MRLFTYKTQTHSINQTSYNSEILNLCHLRRVVPRQVVFPISEESFINETCRDMFEKASKSDCTETIVLSPDPFPPIPSTSSAMKTEEADDDREPGFEGVSKFNIPLIIYAFQV
jgi:hypothetical protein